MKNKVFGHLKTRLFTINTSKDVGLGGPWWFNLSVEIHRYFLNILIYCDFFQSISYQIRIMIMKLHHYSFKVEPDPFHPGFFFHCTTGIPDWLVMLFREKQLVRKLTNPPVAINTPEKKWSSSLSSPVSWPFYIPRPKSGPKKNRPFFVRSTGETAEGFLCMPWVEMFLWHFVVCFELINQHLHVSDSCLKLWIYHDLSAETYILRCVRRTLVNRTLSINSISFW